jgi:hypothetical protein
VHRIVSLLAGVLLTAWFGGATLSAGEPRVLFADFVDLRSGDVREWSEFPEHSQGDRLETRFSATKNDREFALRLRQHDVKQAWRVLLNDKPLGNLVIDENDQVGYLPIPPGALVGGENTLKIEPAKRGGASDDIRVGEIRLEERPVREALDVCKVAIEVVDANRKQPLPCRLTILDANGSLHAIAAQESEDLAVRAGFVYTSTGKAEFGLPVGRYTIYAGRGFEYSLAKVEITLSAGQSVRETLSLRREVPTEGYVACDTHIHTLTFSGHGDATIVERMVTLAAEGIELPIATDHNVHIDYEQHAKKSGVRQYFTPVIGNEVTTPVGHFNVFPVNAGARVPNAKLREWPAIFEEVYATPGVKVAILNHARDLHSGVRPFGPKLHNAVVGENLNGWPLRFNAMEVVNSGAVQSDPLRLLHDWMALLNRGLTITPVGASDSHDVARHFVGQGRTYIRTDDRDPGKIDVADAVASFQEGRVLVSYGLLVEMTVGGKYQSGELAAASGKELQVDLRVLGPHWTSASKIQLYANGRLIREEAIAAQQTAELPTGVKWKGTWTVPKPKHDVHLVAIALGPGIEGSYWKTAKPYQPTSPDWNPYTLACSGAIRLNADGDGRWSSPRDYAEQIVASSKADLSAAIAALANYDEATAAQAAHLLRTVGTNLISTEVADLLTKAPPPVQRGFGDYIEAWKENERAALE